MLRDEATIKPALYRLPDDALSRNILVPAFRQSTHVQGAFGWFTAGWIKSLAPGLAHFIAREDHRSIDFVIAPYIFEPEYNAFRRAFEDEEQLRANINALLRDVQRPGADELARHALDCLAWMVATDLLRLRIAKPKPNTTYHPKVWLFSYGQDCVAVRGSANATGHGTDGSVEHMDVDCSWLAPGRVASAQAMVGDWWEGRDATLEQVVPLPEALLEDIIKLAPSRPPDPPDWEHAGRTSQAQHPDEREVNLAFRIPPWIEWKSGEFRHQAEAVYAWEEAGRTGILSMATGSGKTIASLIAAYRLHQETPGPTLVIISAPSTLLIQQWKEECDLFQLPARTPTIRSTVNDRRQALGSLRFRLRHASEDHAEALIITNNLLTKSDFQDAMTRTAEQVPSLTILHIGDEAHTLGAPSFASDPPTMMRYRLGLSATAVREYDEVGTDAILEYFGGNVYEFGLDRAIGFCLSPYRYHVHTCYLEEDELEEFAELSSRIGVLMGRGGSFEDENLTGLIMKRRAVTETATQKLLVLREILEESLSVSSHLLIYCSSRDPEQLQEAKAVVSDAGIVCRQVTEKESASPKVLREILGSFERGSIEALIAKKVLDEGVDIPVTREAVILASSLSSREWIQRRGRLLRRAEGKGHATIHDIVALPPPERYVLSESTLRFVSSELDRVREFARYADNGNEIGPLIEGLHAEYFA